MKRHRILIAPDKFKGTLTAAEAAEAIATGWLRSRPEDIVDQLPITDGGDGFGPVMASLTGAAAREVRTVDAAGQPITARWWYSAARGLAIIEAAQSNGLAMLPGGKFDIGDLDTTGVADLLMEAAEAGARECWVGIGGSATNDGGFGMARGLGWRFLDAQGTPITRWPQLERLQRMEPPSSPALKGTRLRVAVDVDNPLLGPEGCTARYGPQKGLAPSRAGAVERALDCLARTAEAAGLGSAQTLQGAGAAGGLGFGLVAFAGAVLESGFGLFAGQAALKERIAVSDWVVTAEGRMDATTLMGKGTGGVARLCHQLGKPCFGLAGGTDGTPDLHRLFASVRAIVPARASLADALREPCRFLADMSAEAAIEAGNQTT